VWRANYQNRVITQAWPEVKLRTHLLISWGQHDAYRINVCSPHVISVCTVWSWCWRARCLACSFLQSSWISSRLYLVMRQLLNKFSIRGHFDPRDPSWPSLQKYVAVGTQFYGSFLVWGCLTTSRNRFSTMTCERRGWLCVLLVIYYYHTGSSHRGKKHYRALYSFRIGPVSQLSHRPSCIYLILFTPVSVWYYIWTCVAFSTFLPAIQVIIRQ
jgi:hypothetical protein